MTCTGTEDISTETEEGGPSTETFWRANLLPFTYDTETHTNTGASPGLPEGDLQYCVSELRSRLSSIGAQATTSLVLTTGLVKQRSLKFVFFLFWTQLCLYSPTFHPSHKLALIHTTRCSVYH